MAVCVEKTNLSQSQHKERQKKDIYWKGKMLLCITRQIG